MVQSWLRGMNRITTASLGVVSTIFFWLVYGHACAHLCHGSGRYNQLPYQTSYYLWRVHLGDTICLRGPLSSLLSSD
jgi:hypothetical protein